MDATRIKHVKFARSEQEMKHGTFLTCVISVDVKEMYVGIMGTQKFHKNIQSIQALLDKKGELCI